MYLHISLVSYVLGAKDFVEGSKDYKKNLIIKIVSYTEKNMKIANRKVDAISEVQKYLKLGVGAIIVCSLFVVIIDLIRN